MKMNDDVLIFLNSHNSYLYSPMCNLFFDTNIKNNKKISYYRLKNEKQVDIFKQVNKLMHDLTLMPNIDYILKNIKPILGSIVITNKCNMNCEFCYANANTNTEEPSITVEDIVKLKEKNKHNEFLFSKVSITGGEPLLYFDLIRQMRKYFKDCIIFTNGALLNEEIVKWCIDTKTKIYVNLDIERDNVKGHKSNITRNKIREIIKRYPEFKECINANSKVIEASELTDLKAHEQQLEEWEKEQETSYLLSKGTKEDFKYDTLYDYFEERLKRDDFKSSFFELGLRYYRLAKLIPDNINIMSCSNNFTVTWDKKVGLCMTQMSNPYAKDRFAICDLDDFTEEIYRDAILKKKYFRFSNCFKSDCIAKNYCGGVCWANISSNLYNCYRFQYMLPFILYHLLDKMGIEFFLSNYRPNIKIDENDIEEINFEDIEIYDYSRFNDVIKGGCGVCKKQNSTAS